MRVPIRKVRWLCDCRPDHDSSATVHLVGCASQVRTADMLDAQPEHVDLVDEEQHKAAAN